MDFRACYCATLGSPFLERSIPAKVNQASNNYYFEQQSHTKGRDSQKAAGKSNPNFCGKPAASSGIDDPPL
jgi:hypothetical protein